MGWPITPEEVVRRFVGGSSDVMLAEVERHLGRERTLEFDRVSTEEITIAFERELQPIDGVRELIDSLDSAGVPSCVASSGSHQKMRLTLGITGMWETFGGAHLLVAGCGSWQTMARSVPPRRSEDGRACRSMRGGGRQRARGEGGGGCRDGLLRFRRRTDVRRRARRCGCETVRIHARSFDDVGTASMSGVALESRSKRPTCFRQRTSRTPWACRLRARPTRSRPD